MMFIDTSAIVAILANEADGPELAQKIDVGRSVTSALVILESTMVLSSKLDIDPLLIESRIAAFLDVVRADVMAIDRATASLAIKAFAAYGKGRGHPAQLNLADCLSYACAEARGVGLLYKGQDFSQTELA